EYDPLGLESRDVHIPPPLLKTRHFFFKTDFHFNPPTFDLELLRHIYRDIVRPSIGFYPPKPGFQFDVSNRSLYFHMADCFPALVTISTVAFVPQRLFANYSIVPEGQSHFLSGNDQRWKFGSSHTIPPGYH